MLKSIGLRCVVAVIALGGCALLAGCLSESQTYFSSLFPASNSASQSHDVDPQARRIVVRPELGTAPVRGTQVFIATVYDADGKPRRKRRVEWMLEGPGHIIEVGGSSRDAKVNNKFAISQTDDAEHRITRGKDEFTIGPGQTWCLVTSAVEGETTIIAYCPAIGDVEKNRAYVKVNWVEGNLLFPAPVTARAGGDYTLNTTVTRPGDGAAGYRVRYRIIDGPAAALTAGKGGEVTSVTEAVAPIGIDGYGRINITQPLAAAGTNRIGIEVVKPDPDRPGQFTVVSKGETRVTWAASRLDLSVSAPKTLGLNQDATVTYTVSATGKPDSGAVTLTTRLPDEMVLIRTEPKAAVDGETLIWTLPAMSGGKSQSVQAVVRPVRVGTAELSADVRSADGLTGSGACPVTIAEAKLTLKLDGPASGIVGEALPFQVTVTNTGDGPADRVRVQGRLDDGLETANKAATLDETISSIAAGQSKTIQLPLSARQVGKFGIQVSASADRGLVAVPQSATVEVKEAQLALSVHGPARGYIGQEVTWQLVVRNAGDVPMGNVDVKAALPPEVTFVKATNGGKLVGKQIVWDLGTLNSRQEPTVAVTGTCSKIASRAALVATVAGTPVADADGRRRPVSLIKPVGPQKPVESAVEIVGVPVLHMSVKDSSDPVAVGQRITYTVRVKNAGTQAASKVEVVANVPEAMLPTRGTGPGPAAKITGQKVVFPALDLLAPNAEATFVVEVEAKLTGDVQFAVEVRSASQAQPLRSVEPTRIIEKTSLPFER